MNCPDVCRFECVHHGARCCGAWLQGVVVTIYRKKLSKTDNVRAEAINRIAKLGMLIPIL